MTGVDDGAGGFDLGPFAAKWLDQGGKRLGIAVSGGSDSMALLIGLTEHLPAASLYAATVNHGLRAEAASEAQYVHQICAGLGVSHVPLGVEGLSKGGNLQARARQARYKALTNWALAQGLDAVALGHTQNDVAENFLLRLARGSGVKGLAAMQAEHTAHGITWLRPMLGLSRDDLQAELRRRGVEWIEDPSNDDTSFDRVKMRKAEPMLAELGLSQARLAQTAQSMAQAQGALAYLNAMALRDCVSFDFRTAHIDHAALKQFPKDTADRVLAGVVQWVGGTDYPPRYESLQRAILAPAAATLNGTHVLHPTPQTLCVTREYNSVAKHMVGGTDLWDGAWRFARGTAQDEIRALGAEGLAQCETWRDTGRARVELLASPSLWRGRDLLSAPLAGFCPEYGLEFTKPALDFDYTR